MKTKLNRDTYYTALDGTTVKDAHEPWEIDETKVPWPNWFHKWTELISEGETEKAEELRQRMAKEHEARQKPNKDINKKSKELNDLRHKALEMAKKI